MSRCDARTADAAEDVGRPRETGGPNIESIHHAALFTADYAATAAFYREVFGAEAPSTCEQPSAVRLGGVTLHVFEDDRVGADWSPTHLHHIALLTSGLDEFVAVRQRLVDRGACDGASRTLGCT